MPEEIDVQPPPDFDRTGKVQKVIETQMTTVKRIQFWVTLGLTLAGLGFGCALYLTRFAQATEVQQLSSQVDAVHDQLRQHVTVESERVGKLEAVSKNTEQDYHFMRDQLWRVAERVGAEKVPAPKH